MSKLTEEFRKVTSDPPERLLDLYRDYAGRMCSEIEDLEKFVRALWLRASYQEVSDILSRFEEFHKAGKIDLLIRVLSLEAAGWQAGHAADEYRKSVGELLQKVKLLEDQISQMSYVNA